MAVCIKKIILEVIMKEQDLGKVIDRIEKLEKAIFGDKKITKEERKSKVIASPDINFSINERAFIKRYATNKSGPKKFTLLLAYLTKGELEKSIELNEIKKNWNKMKAKTLLGKFNMFYPNEAKTKGWIDSRKYGTYCLANEWENVL